MAIPDNALFFTGDMDSKVTPSGKTFSMPISDTTQYIYLNSQLINSFDLKVNNENIKNVQIGYDYYYKNSTISDPNETKVFEKGELSPEPFLNEASGYYDSFYKIPIVTKNAGSVKVWAKMHRTAEIEKAFVAGGFDEIVTVMKNSGNSTVDKEKSILLLKYIEEFL